MALVVRTSPLTNVRALHHSCAGRRLTKRDLIDNRVFLDYSSTGYTEAIACRGVVLDYRASAISAYRLYSQLVF
jgi:hypothetical protein